MDELLSAEEVRLLASYYSTLDLTPQQCDAIGEKWFEASKTERRLIAAVYCKLFSDPAFVQRIFMLRESSSADSTATAAGSTSRRGGRASRTELRLRLAIDEITPKLPETGTAVIEFGLISNDEERQEVLDIYQSQFTQPDAPTMSSIVTIPRAQSTRTRKNVAGSHTWFIRCLTTNEMVCCVTATVHRSSTCFVEVPLFATRSGYKKNGFARLLNAALIQFCMDHVRDCKFLMVSADRKAVPFWRHLGYTDISKSDMQSIAFQYEHNCLKFEDSSAMTVSIAELKRYRDQRIQNYHQHAKAEDASDSQATPPPTSESMLVMDVLAKTNRLLLSGPPYLQSADVRVR